MPCRMYKPFVEFFGYIKSVLVDLLIRMHCSKEAMPASTWVIIAGFL